MKKGRLQCKDIPDKPILQFIYDYEKANEMWCGISHCGFPNDVQQAMPVLKILDKDNSYNLALAKMKKLIVKGLVSGCYCGCRGDFELTFNGLVEIGVEQDFEVLDRWRG